MYFMFTALSATWLASDSEPTRPRLDVGQTSISHLHSPTSEIPLFSSKYVAGT